MEERAISKSTDEWKTRFGEILTAHIASILKKQTISELDAYKYLINKQNYKNKINIWKQLEKEHNITSKKLHDYFHNTYSKKFSLNVKLIEAELYDLFDQNYSKFGEKNKTIQTTIQEITQKYQNQIIHYQSVYQMLNNYCKKTLIVDDQKQHDNLKKQIYLKDFKDNNNKQFRNDIADQLKNRFFK